MKKLVCVLAAVAILLLVSVNWSADYRTELAYTLPYTGINHTIHKYKSTPDGNWAEGYVYTDTVIFEHALVGVDDRYDTVAVTFTAPASPTVAKAVTGLTAAINANATLLPLITAVDSVTYVRIWADDSDLAFRVISDTGQTVAKVAPGAAARGRIDTLYYYPTRGGYQPYKPSDFERCLIQYQMDNVALTNCSLVVVVQFANGNNWDTAVTRNIRYDTLNITRDSLFSTSGWNLEKYLTATDTLMHWDAIRVMFLRIYTINDTGATFLTKADSTYNVYLDFIFKGFNGNVGTK